MHIETQRLEDYEPIYNPGDYWQRSSGTAVTGNFTALSYYNSAEGHEHINTLDITMTDLYHSPRNSGRRQREDVLTAYPEAVTGNYWISTQTSRICSPIFPGAATTPVR